MAVRLEAAQIDTPGTCYCVSPSCRGGERQWHVPVRAKGDTEYRVPACREKTAFLQPRDSHISQPSVVLQLCGWTFPRSVPPGAGAREMTGAGVPVLKAERSQKGIVTMCGSSSVALRWRRDSQPVAKSRRTLSYPPLPTSVVESGHKMRQPRAGHQFFPPTPAALSWPGFGRVRWGGRGFARRRGDAEEKIVHAKAQRRKGVVNGAKPPCISQIFPRIALKVIGLRR